MTDLTNILAQASDEAEQLVQDNLALLCRVNTLEGNVKQLQAELHDANEALNESDVEALGLKDAIDSYRVGIAFWENLAAAAAVAIISLSIALYSVVTA